MDRCRDVGGVPAVWSDVAAATKRDGVVNDDRFLVAEAPSGNLTSSTNFTAEPAKTLRSARVNQLGDGDGHRRFQHSNRMSRCGWSSASLFRKLAKRSSSGPVQPS